MKTVWVALGALGFISGAAFLVLWLLAWTGQVPPGEPLAISGGVMLLVTALFSLRAAADKTADRGTWARTNVKISRLSAFAKGTFFCAIAAGILGSLWLSKQFGIGIAAVVLASFALTCFGKTLDGRRARAEAALNKPAARGAEPGAAPDRGGRS
jgi:hypothetical protein